MTRMNVANNAITFKGRISMKHDANNTMVTNIFSVSPTKNR